MNKFVIFYWKERCNSIVNNAKLLPFQRNRLQCVRDQIVYSLFVMNACAHNTPLVAVIWALELQLIVQVHNAINIKKGSCIDGNTIHTRDIVSCVVIVIIRTMVWVIDHSSHGVRFVFVASPGYWAIRFPRHTGARSFYRLFMNLLCLRFLSTSQTQLSKVPESQIVCSAMLAMRCLHVQIQIANDSILLDEQISYFQFGKSGWKHNTAAGHNLFRCERKSSTGTPHW